jgi:hypothetical protein
MKKAFLTISLIFFVFTFIAYNYSSLVIGENKNSDKIFPKFENGSSSAVDTIPIGQKLISGPWVGGAWNQENENWLSLFKNTSNNTKIPYINLYTVAGLASAKESLQDCNVGADPEKTLCKNGANFIRKNKKELITVHNSIAESIKSNYGTDKPILLHFEPDYLQYHDNSQNGGGLSREELADQMNTWTTIYKNKVPNAYLVMDISPWNYDLKGWSSKFRNFDYGGLVGARFNTKIEGKDGNGKNFPTYKEMVQLTGKKIIVNDSHGPGGKWLPHNPTWDDKWVVDKLFEDGVVAVIRPPS